MAAKPPKDVAARLSRWLSRTLEGMVEDPERKQPPTLGNVRMALLESGMQWSVDGELLHPQDRTSLIIELDELIEAYGEGALAEEFIRLG